MECDILSLSHIHLYQVKVKLLLVIINEYYVFITVNLTSHSLTHINQMKYIYYCSF